MFTILKSSQNGVNPKTQKLKRIESHNLLNKRINTLLNNELEISFRRDLQKAVCKPKRVDRQQAKECLFDKLNIGNNIFRHWVFEGSWWSRAIAEIQIIKNTLHVQYRLALARCINNRVRENYRRFKEKSFRKLLTSMSGGQVSDLSTLLLPDGTISVDEIAIHDCLTERMESCFKQNVSPQLDVYPPHVVPPHFHISGWERAISEPGYIISHPNLQHIPADLLEVIEYAFQSNRTNTALITDMAAAFADDNPITIVEFEAQIKGGSNDKSPGLTGFSINMMKKLPVECREYIYHLISTFWTFGSNNHIPSFWKDRYLALIPKDKNKAISADRVRPISLYEVTRKLWTGAIIRRITNLWERHRAVNDTQNAYRKHKGVDLPVLQVINAVQNILADSTELLCSSYDIQQCFDSVNRPLVIASYMRLGVPKNIARSLVLLDIDGVTVIRTPHSIKSLARGRHHLSTLVEKSDNQTARVFIARDGIGQGDKTAAPSFTAISDIENVALERLHSLAESRGITTTSCLPVIFPLGNQILKATPPIIYADDKNILFSTFEHAQLAADIISGFSCIAGFTQNFKNFVMGQGHGMAPYPHLYYMIEIGMLLRLLLRYH